VHIRDSPRTSALYSTDRLVLLLILFYSYGEFMTLFAKTVAERTKPGQRQDVEEQGILGYGLTV
jgi:hypothetical protein